MIINIYDQNFTIPSETKYYVKYHDKKVTMKFCCCRIGLGGGGGAAAQNIPL